MKEFKRLQRGNWFIEIEPRKAIDLDWNCAKSVLQDAAYPRIQDAWFVDENGARYVAWASGFLDSDIVTTMIGTQHSNGDLVAFEAYLRSLVTPKARELPEMTARDYLKIITDAICEIDLIEILARHMDTITDLDDLDALRAENAILITYYSQAREYLKATEESKTE
jgi:hypothetical protein